jgi:putative ABC transport system permease protein
MRRIRPVLCSAFAFLAVLTLTTSGVSAPEQWLGDVALPRQTAERLGVRVGDVIEVSRDPAMRGSRSLRVAAVFEAAEHPADVARGDLELRLHLPLLESLLERPDIVDRIVVRVRRPDEAGQVRDELKAFGPGYDVYTADELVAHTSRTFVVVSRFHRAIASIAVTASAIFLVTIMSLKLAEMRREIGALRLLGVGRQTIGLTVIAIAGVVAIVGSLAGVGLGAVLVWAINVYYQPLFETRLRFAVLTPDTVVAACGLAVAVGLAAGAVVAVRLMQQHPLEQVGR